jgi:hypothetical protein
MDPPPIPRRDAMRFAAAVLLLLVGCTHPGTTSSAADDSGPLVGMWRLVEMVNVRDDGTTTPSFLGPHPTGYIVYDRAGRMAVQLMGDPRPTFKDPDHPADAEAKAAYESFVAYAGTYTYDSVRRIVTHHLETSLWPPGVGRALSREVRLDGDRVVLVTEPYKSKSGENVRLRLTWERVRPP